MRTTRWLLLLLILGVIAAGCTSEEGAGTDAGEEDVDAALPGEPTGGAAEVVQEESPETEDTGGGGGGGAGGDLAQTVQDRGSVVCGVNDAVPGFGFTDEAGEFSGFDIDFCRAIAAAVFNDPEATEFRPLTADQRFTALASGEIDVLVRNTTWTSSRDGGEGATFLTTTFYDGQGMMVRADSEFQTLEDMQNTQICTLTGTTTELNLAARFAAGGIAYEPVPFTDNETLQQAFVEGRCDGWTSDKSQLAGVRSNFPEGPEALRILEETFSKEPLGPAVADGEVTWAQMVDWVVIATIQAEEFGITQANVEEMKTSENPEILRFLGQAGGEEGAVFEAGLGFDDPEWAANMIAAVGNYGEIYARNVGPDTALGLERGLNALWTADPPGLHYAPPYR